MYCSGTCIDTTTTATAAAAAKCSSGQTCTQRQLRRRRRHGRHHGDRRHQPEPVAARDRRQARGPAAAGRAARLGNRRQRDRRQHRDRWDWRAVETGGGGATAPAHRQRGCASRTSRRGSRVDGDPQGAADASGWYVYYRDRPPQSERSRRRRRVRTDRSAVAAAVTPLPRAIPLRQVRAALDGTGHAGRHPTTTPASAPRSAQTRRGRLSGRSRRTRTTSARTTGIKFNIKSGSGTAPPVWFEMGTLGSNSPLASGGTAATTQRIDQYNIRGQADSSDHIGTSWTTVTFRSGRWLHASSRPPASGLLRHPHRQVPGAGLGNPANALASSSRSTTTVLHLDAGTYDLWVDDVSSYTGDTGLPTRRSPLGERRRVG